MSRTVDKKKGFEVPKSAKKKEDILKPRQIINPKQNAIIAFVIFVFVMIVYQMTNSTSLAFWDSGEYATTLSLIHI